MWHQGKLKPPSYRNTKGKVFFLLIRCCFSIAGETLWRYTTNTLGRRKYCSFFYFQILHSFSPFGFIHASVVFHFNARIDCPEALRHSLRSLLVAYIKWKEKCKNHIDKAETISANHVCYDLVQRKSNWWMSGWVSPESTYRQGPFQIMMPTYVLISTFIYIHSSSIYCKSIITIHFFGTLINHLILA